jgi:hypothetical protein
LTAEGYIWNVKWFLSSPRFDITVDQPMNVTVDLVDSTGNPWQGRLEPDFDALMAETREIIAESQHLETLAHALLSKNRELFAPEQIQWLIQSKAVGHEGLLDAQEPAPAKQEFSSKKGSKPPAVAEAAQTETAEPEKKSKGAGTSSSRLTKEERRNIRRELYRKAEAHIRSGNMKNITQYLNRLQHRGRTSANSTTTWKPTEKT